MVKGVMGENRKSERDRTSRRPPPERSPVQRALGMLVRREHSRKELTRKLASQGIDAGEAAEAIDKLAKDGWQDDLRFAEMLVRTRAAAGYGPIRIRAYRSHISRTAECLIRGTTSAWTSSATSCTVLST